jgi:ABC-2 type transport system ATP-binding protein
VLVETHNLTKRYGDVVALDDCSLAVHRGEILGLLGPNGAGKTTLLRLLLGFLRPTAGRATIDGWDCCRESVQARSVVSYLPGEARLFRQMRGRGVLRFFAEIRPGGSLPLALELAERLELDLNRRVAFMSTGMRQKLALAVTLAAQTPLVILDEPTSNLDPSIRSVVLELVAEARSGGRTVIFSSHVLSEVEQVCDRVAFLRGGCLVHLQVMAELKRQHCIRAALDGPLPPAPDELQGQVRITRGEEDGAVVIETAGQLTVVLRWLAASPLTDVIVEPVGLNSLYRSLHSPASATPSEAS